MKNNLIETAINWTDETAHMSSNDRKVIKRMLQLYETHPDEIRILQSPEVNGGYLLADIPARCVKLAFPRKRTLTDNQRIACAERLKVARSRKQDRQGERANETSIFTSQ